MFKNYIKIAWRSLKKRPFFTFLNTFGLAIGMAGGLLISLYLIDELSFDTMYPDADRIYRVDSSIKFGGKASEVPQLSAPMGAAMKEDFPQVEEFCRMRNWGSTFIRKSDVENNAKEEQIAFADPTFFDMFGIELLAGDAKTALEKPMTLVLTESAAEKHFGVHEAVGQTVLLDNDDLYTVTGVIADMPRNSMFRDHTIFMAMDGLEDSREPNWTSHNYYTFIRLTPGSDVADLEQPLHGMLDTYIIPYVQRFFPGITMEQFEASGNYLRYSPINVQDIRLHSDKYPEVSQNGSMQNVYILSFIAIFLIVLASVNFMNLSTAHSLKRAMEVGIRKTLGSQKTDIVRQFLIESGLISFISLVLALILALVALPFFNELAGKELQMPFENPLFWLVLLASTVLLALVSGSYPAFFMSRFGIVRVLKGTGDSGKGDGTVRNGLVVFQFAISIFLIIGTLVVFQQLKYIQNKDLGYSKEQVLVLNDLYMADEGIPSLKREIERLGQVNSVTVTGYLPTPSSRSDSSFYVEEKPNQEDAISLQHWVVDHDYAQTLGLQLIAGRDFDRERLTDSTAIVLNAKAAKVLGLTPQEVLGKRISGDMGSENPLFYTVIGVVEDFHFDSLKKDIEAWGMYLGNSRSRMAIKMETGNLTATINQIENLWHEVAPGAPFNYEFLDASFNDTYRAEQRLGRIFVIFTILSILIACLGLFGLAAFNADKRTKEIGVRKVMGASVSQITYRLTMDFLKLVGWAVLVALPIGWFAMDSWLKDFSYRINVSWWVLVLAAVLAAAIAIVTVGYQSIKAAVVNPVKSLRSE